MGEHSSAVERIRRELAEEGASRGRRAGVVAAVWIAATVIGLLITGAHLRTGTPATAAVAALALLGWVGLSLRPRAQLDAWARAVLFAAIALSPLFPLLWVSEAGGSLPDHGAACALLISALGIGALIATRLILGSTARRFGGARDLLALAAAGAAAAGVGLGCPQVELFHLATHGGGLLCVLLAALAMLPGPGAWSLIGGRSHGDR